MGAVVEGGRPVNQDLKNKLDRMFAPKSIAVIGASSREGQFSNDLVRSLSRGKGVARVYPVNPRVKELYGYKCYGRLADIPEKVDLAYVTLPAALVPGIMGQCVEAGVEGCVIYSSGFAETGKSGRGLQEEVLKVASAGGVRIIGPNCLGICNFHQGLLLGLQGLKADVGDPGSVAVISHSGSMCGSMVGIGYERGLRFSKTVSCGNRADIGTVDLLQYLGQDDDTSLILMYLEGVEDGRGLMHALEGITPLKPVLIWKSGRTASGAKAASSHSAALAGAYDTFKAAVTQSGAVVCTGIEDLLDLAAAFYALKVPAGNRLGIVSGPGGVAVAAADACDEHGLVLAEFCDGTVGKMNGFLPPFGSPFNPVDLTTAVIFDMELYNKAIDAATEDPNTDMVLALGPVESKPKEFGETIVKGNHKGMAKPLAVALTATAPTYKAAQSALTAGSIPFYPSPDRAVNALGGLFRYGNKRRKQKGDAKQSCSVEWRQGVSEGVILEARRKHQDYLTEHQAMSLLEDAGIPVAKRIHAKDLEGCCRAAREIGYPVVVKVSSYDVVHKTDSGGVALDVRDEQGLATAFRQVTQSPLLVYPEARIDGVLVEEQVKAKLELALGFVRDPQFGQIIMLSLGGVFIEVFKDVSTRVGPLMFWQCMEMINDLKASVIFQGFRGITGADKRSLARCILAVDTLASRLPDVFELDVNPLAVTADGFVALDARVRLGPGS